jgi:hypothetical protein
MQLKDYLIVLVIMGLVMWCIGGSVYLLNKEYNTDSVNISVIDDMGGDLDALNSNVNQTYGTVAKGGSVSAGGVAGIIFNSIGNFFLSVFNIITMPFRWMASIGTTFGIPSIIITAIISIILIGITFAVVRTILGRSP